MFKYQEVNTLAFVHLVPQDTSEMKMFLVRDKANLHTSVSTAGPITNFGRQCCHMHPTVFTSHHHIMTCLVLKTPARTTLHQVQGTAERNVPVAAEGEQRLPGGNTGCCSKVEEE
jgi:hypothetical protein